MSNLFPGRGGGNCLSHRETHIIYVLQGGLDPLPPAPLLWIRACNIWINWMLWQKLDIRKKLSILNRPECPICKHGVWENNNRGLIRIQIICHFRVRTQRSNHCILPFALKLLKTCHLLINVVNSLDPHQAEHSVRAYQGQTVWHLKVYDKLKLNRYILTMHQTFTWHCYLLITLCK